MGRPRPLPRKVSEGSSSRRSAEAAAAHLHGGGGLRGLRREHELGDGVRHGALVVGDVRAAPRRTAPPRSVGGVAGRSARSGWPRTTAEVEAKAEREKKASKEWQSQTA